MPKKKREQAEAIVEEAPSLVPTRRSGLSVLGEVSLVAEGVRVPLEVRLAHLERRRLTCPVTTELLKLTSDYEASVDAMLARHIAQHPAYPWFSHVKGCGPENIAKVVAEIEAFGRYYPVGDPMIPHYVNREPEEYQKVIDPEDYPLAKHAQVISTATYRTLVVTEYTREGRRYFHYKVVGKDRNWTTEVLRGVWVEGIERLATPSKLRKLSGHMPGLKREKGHLLAYNETLKMLMWRMGTSLMRAGGKFYSFYSTYKLYLIERETAKGTKIMPTPKVRLCPACQKEVIKRAARFCPDCNGPLSLKTEPPGVLYQGHLHDMAAARMQQAFLDALWAAWRDALGLPVMKPYPHEFQAKSHHEEWIKYQDWMDK